MKKVLKSVVLIIVGAIMIGCQQNPTEKLKFAYFADLHLGAKDGERDSTFRQALQDAKSNDVDFVLLGGDYFAADRCSKDQEEMVIETYKRLQQMVKDEGLESYYTPGNHDRFFFHKGEPSIIGHDMYQEQVGKLIYSFDYNGVHFVILNSTELTEGGEYYTIKQEQLEWLKQDLEKTGKETPIVVSLHVPLMSLYHLAIEGEASVYSAIINSKEVVDILKPYNVKVVLQGHNHIYEEILVGDRWYVTGGATLGAWPSEEGYVLVEVDIENNFSWDYIKF